MRKDMDKVIVERPRIGSRLPSRKKGYRKYVQSTSAEDLPCREPMLGRWKGRQKWLNEHLGPMRRFLRSNIGRPWNKVHSELCEHVSFNNAVQAHVLSHVYDYVNKNTHYDGAKIVSMHEWGYSRVLQEGEMYICPTSGLLKVVKKNKRRIPPTKVLGNAGIQYLKRDHQWWEVRVRPRPDHSDTLWDVWLEKDVADLTNESSIAAYGGKLFAISKRLLKPTEVKQLYKSIRQKRKQRKQKRIH